MVSLDSYDPKVHDEYRQIPGLFDMAVKGIERAKKAGASKVVVKDLKKRFITARRVTLWRLTVR